VFSAAPCQLDIDVTFDRRRKVGARFDKMGLDWATVELQDSFYTF